ncbi:prolyl oligopeptidase family serine peptidase [Herbidospora sp. NEAU-GS84]|uniref:Prolyl oligopeptidase family serine peptidase n=1 Tax=Herbidospora solisilvae TaxID=2696284 RepID=A0A7C9N4M0_9ACTN|nr:prolyl oligopeptidase family serine peptidase [Herbidospora solisilvae]NAS25709.1 prolyl oligopeptidase family serine peptidase [Herbidospora solisilvae]
MNASRIVPATGETAAAREHGPYLARVNFRFSGRARYAACLTHGGGVHGMIPELWDLTGPRPRSRMSRSRTPERLWTLPTPTHDGRLLLARRDRADAVRLVLLDPPTGEEHELAVFGPHVVALTPSPAPGTAAWAFTGDAAGRGTVWRLSGQAEPPELTATLPHPVVGGLWLDATGRRLTLRPKQPQVAPQVLDLTDGTLMPLAGPADDEYLLWAAPAGTLLTAAHRDGAYRLGLRHRDDAQAATVFPDRLNLIEGQVRPLALDPAGRRLALAVTRGARSHLLLHDLIEDTSREVGLPPGTLHALARWTEAGLHLLHNAPDRPPSVLTVPEPIAEVVPGDRQGVPASVRACAGPAGTIEAIVYGDPATARRVVIALHGGPEAAWHLAYDPLFQRLAGAGVAVVAPNQRGSTGYGTAHRDAIRGAWGGPDLADVLHLGHALAGARGPAGSRPMVYGASYGAYLALLASAARPELWERAAVVAPFLSGPALYADGPPTVRTMIDRLGGREVIYDALGPRDLLRLGDRIRLPLLIVHGEQDPIIPVTHSRRLRDRLLRAGRREGADFVYREVAGAGHDPVTDDVDGGVLDQLAAFLTSGP